MIQKDRDSDYYQRAFREIAEICSLFLNHSKAPRLDLYSGQKMGIATKNGIIENDFINSPKSQLLFISIPCYPIRYNGSHVECSLYPYHPLRRARVSPTPSCRTQKWFPVNVAVAGAFLIYLGPFTP